MIKLQKISSGFLFQYPTEYLEKLFEHFDYDGLISPVAGRAFTNTWRSIFKPALL